LAWCSHGAPPFTTMKCCEFAPFVCWPGSCLRGGVMSAPPGSKSPLLESVRVALAVRHYSERTVEAYVGWVRRFVVFHHRQHPRLLGAREVERFLGHLAVDESVSSSTQNQALAALVFLYKEVLQKELGPLGELARAKRPMRMPVVMTREEIRLLHSHMTGVWSLMGSLMYGSGLRLSECVSLRVRDIDLGGPQLLVRRGKGQRDRATLLPRGLIARLTEHLRIVKARHERDVADGGGFVQLPDALGVKYPKAAREWPWQWVFPASRQHVDASTGERRRHHLHETALQ
jgi:integron integrase